METCFLRNTSGLLIVQLRLHDCSALCAIATLTPASLIQQGEFTRNYDGVKRTIKIKYKVFVPGGGSIGAEMFTLPLDNTTYMLCYNKNTIENLCHATSI